MPVPEGSHRMVDQELLTKKLAAIETHLRELEAFVAAIRKRVTGTGD